MSKKQTYECWKEEGDAIGISFFPSNNKSARDALEPGAKLLYRLEAENWEEAVKEHKRRQGWET